MQRIGLRIVIARRIYHLIWSNYSKLLLFEISHLCMLTYDTERLCITTIPNLPDRCNYLTWYFVGFSPKMTEHLKICYLNRLCAS